MRLLALETSGRLGGIALADGPQLIEEVRLSEGLRHGRDLILVTKEACERAGWQPRQIDVVAVSIGPGSFTGLRIAVTAAKTIAWDTGARVVTVPTLRAMAENAPAETQRVVPILDAKRGGLYAGIFERPAGGQELVETFGPALVTPEELAVRLEPPALVLGRGLRKAREALAAFEQAPEEWWDPRPGVVARLGWERAEAGAFADPLRLEPIYIRRPEAEEIWERKHRGR
jgi:tRNA threonylcarbamoyladenosine biosynthesis protein TsaB